MTCLSVIIAGALTVAVGLLALIAMPESGFRRRQHDEERPKLGELFVTAREGARFARRTPLILLLCATTLFAGAASEAFDRLREAHLIRDVGLPQLGSLDPVVWFGLLGVASMVVGLLGTTVLLRHFERATRGGMARPLLALTAVLAAGWMAFALAGSFAPAVGALLVAGLARSSGRPLYMTWLNQQITDSSVRP